MLLPLALVLLSQDSPKGTNVPAVRPGVGAPRKTMQIVMPPADLQAQNAILFANVPILVQPKVHALAATIARNYLSGKEPRLWAVAQQEILKAFPKFDDLNTALHALLYSEIALRTDADLHLVQTERRQADLDLVSLMDQELSLTNKSPALLTKKWPESKPPIANNLAFSGISYIAWVGQAHSAISKPGASELEKVEVAYEELLRNRANAKFAIASLTSVADKLVALRSTALEAYNMAFPHISPTSSKLLAKIGPP
ncbi:MAG: hypothetical protein JSS72_07055 [Armatimonadetes bacterium]|nr:hypothetical protein [Armatimonadota bacterium]